ncbi:MAG: ABC transporter ATP-binding protein [Gemmatimonadetes bacterium]|nr:ABC transporter ATP-binding protein [Gemmatimonadota bacterium]
MRLYLRILRYLRPYLGLLAGAVLASLAFAALDTFSLVMLIPFLRTLFGGAPLGAGAGQEALEAVIRRTLGLFVDLDASPDRVLVGIIVFILAVFALKNLFDFVQGYLVVRIEQAVTRDLRNGLYDHLLDLDLAFFTRTKVGQIVSRLTTDVDQLRTLVTRHITKVLASAFQILATTATLVAISLRLTMVAFVVLPAMFAIWGRMLRKLRSGDRRVLDLAGELSSRVQESMSAIRLVKAGVAEDHERRRFRDLSRNYFRTFVRTEALRATAGPITEMLGALGTVVILWYGSRLVLVDGAMDAAAFLAFLGLSMKLYAPVKWLSRFPSLVQPGFAAGDRIFEFLDTRFEIRDAPGAREFAGVEREIAYEGVGFAYRPGQPVLRELSVQVPKGTVVALVGPSGAGKTTMVDLLARFYDATAGRIAIDGTDIREFTVRSLRRKLGIVTQETVLFHDTVRANIAYGMPEATHADVVRAARAAYAHDFIEALPRGYDTVVGERGTELSGGQRQRIAIARAILRDPPILILDEATSALDSEAERLVQRAMETLLAGRTVFVIAHRLSTIQRADVILVLEGGRIVERGRHQELRARGGLYRRLYEMQFAADEGAPDREVAAASP